MKWTYPGFIRKTHGRRSQTNRRDSASLNISVYLIALSGISVNLRRHYLMWDSSSALILDR